MANDDVKVRLSAEDRTKAAFSSVNKSLNGLRDNAGKVNAALGALGVGVSVAGLAALAKKGIDAADALNDMSQRLGVSVKDLASLKLAAEQSGTSLEGVGKGIGKLSRSIGEAEGGNKKMAESLRALGVSSKDPREAFFQLADAVKKIEDPQQRAALLAQVLGKSYEELIPLLAQGGDELRRSAKASESFADAMARLAPDADKFNDQMASLKINSAGAAAEILTKVVPSLNEYIGALRKIVNEGTALEKIGFFTLGFIPAHVLDEQATTAEELGKRVASYRQRIAELKDEGKDASKEIAIFNGLLERQVEILNRPPKRPGAGTVDLSAATKAATPAKQKTIDQAAEFSDEMERGFDAADKELKVYADQAKALEEKIQKQQDFVDGVEQEAFLSGLTNDERETALMLLEAEKLGITDVNRLLEAQGEIRKAAADKEAADAIKKQGDDLYRSVQEGVQRGFAAGLNSIAAGEGGWRGALQTMVDSLRLAMSNALAASLTENFLGILGGKEGVLGLAGSLGLSGKRDGSNPDSAIYVEDVTNPPKGEGDAGGAGGDAPKSDADPAKKGGLLGGLGEMLNTIMAGLKAGLVSLVSAFGDMLGSIFGSAGGGQNWLGAIAEMFGFADGGYTGPGGKYKPAGVVHAGEYVFSAASVRRLGLSALDNLHRLAKGGIVPAMPRWGYAEGGLVNLPAQQAGGAGGANIRIVNSIDPGLAGEFFNSPQGEKVFFNLISRNSSAMRQILA